MAHEVDEDIELVVGDRLGGASRVETIEGHEARAMAPERAGYRVLDLTRAERIAVHRHALGVVARENLEHQTAHDMIAKVGGEVANAKWSPPALGCGRKVRDIQTLFLAQSVVPLIEHFQRRTRNVEILRLRQGSAGKRRFAAAIGPVERKRKILVLILDARRDARRE